VLVHVVGGAHNDGLMMLVVLAACGALLTGRVAGAGAAAVAAGALKASAAFAAPFLLLGSGHRGRFLVGAIAALAGIGALSLLVFGSHLADAIGLVGENQAKTSHYSVPSTLARILGTGVEPLRIGALLLLAGLVVALLWRTWRGGDPIAAAGWAALGLVVASGWLLPWYVVWVLPLAALSRSGALTASALALTAFQLLNRVPL
jgi:hypothetical protein